MITDVVDILFGCWHSNYSFPITSKPHERKSPAARFTGTYVCCLDCGKEFPYDWKEMKVISESEARRRSKEFAPATAEAAPVLASKQAA